MDGVNVMTGDDGNRVSGGGNEDFYNDLWMMLLL